MPAILGGQPAFAPQGVPASLLAPDWPALSAMLQGIHERQYYTEHGPLVRSLEDELCRLWPGQQVICVASDTIAHLMLFGILSPSQIWLPAALPWALAGASAWMAPTSRYDFGPDLRAPADLLTQLDGHTPQRTLLVLAGDECMARREWLHQQAAMRGVVAVSHLACPSMLGSSADAILPPRHACVVSMRGHSLLYAGEGACIVTPDRDLADQLRTMRASSGVQRRMPIDRTVNGRMSEAQAAMALLSLRNLPSRLAALEAFTIAPDVPGLSAIAAGGNRHGLLHVNAREFGLNASQILLCLQQERAALHTLASTALSEHLPQHAAYRAGHCLEITPCMSLVWPELQAVFWKLHQNAPAIRRALSERLGIFSTRSIS